MPRSVSEIAAKAVDDLVPGPPRCGACNDFPVDQIKMAFMGQVSIGSKQSRR